jgi:dTDP-6-deoxy-L-talose 4-dehydrogenase (NAD+)
MKVAVTGASGFVGGHVTAELLRRGLTPVLATRTPELLQARHPQATVVQLDLTAPPADPYTALGRPEVVIHLAWQGLPHFNSLHHLETELPLQMRLLKALVEGGLRHLTVTGTCLEYGTSSGLKSEALASTPSTAYGTAKDTLRQYLEALRHFHPFHLVWTRLFYLHGPGQSPTSLIPSLQRAIANGEPTFKMSGGQQLRDFHPVATAASQIVELALRQQPFGIVNVCSGNPVSVRSFVERYLAERQATIQLLLDSFPYTTYEPFAFWGDVSHLHRCLAS